MKKIILLLSILIQSIIGFCQDTSEKKLVVIDERNLGLMKYDFCNPEGHVNGEVGIRIGLTLNNSQYKKKNDKDTIETYDVYVYKPNNTTPLRRYSAGFVFPKSNYNKASYHWIDDTTFVFTFIDSKHNKTHTETFVQWPSHPDWSLGIMTKDEDSKSKKKKKKST